MVLIIIPSITTVLLHIEFLFLIVVVMSEFWVPAISNKGTDSCKPLFPRAEIIQAE
jgi:hypothetical protein